MKFVLPDNVSPLEASVDSEVDIQMEIQYAEDGYSA
jgi:hypothetical protein